MKTQYFFPVLLFILSGLLSCQKIQERKILNGTWLVEKVELNLQEENMMTHFLKDYQSNSPCCRYVVTFNDDGTCTGTYYLNDTIEYTATGEWDLLKFNKVYVELDRYVHSTMDINRHNRKDYSLSSDENIVQALGNNTFITTLKIKRM